MEKCNRKARFLQAFKAFLNMFKFNTLDEENSNSSIV